MPTISLLTQTDSEGVKFCVDYLAEHWDLKTAEAIDIVMNCAQRKEGAFGVVAKAQNTSVGMVVSFARELEQYPAWGPWVSGLYIAQAHRGGSLAFRMLQCVKNQFLSQGIKRVYLDSMQKPMQQFYKNLGCEIVGKSTWKGCETIIFRIDLKKSK